MKIYTTYTPSNTVKLLQYSVGGGGLINLTFRRNFGVQERAEWDELERDLEGIELNDEVDSDGHYTWGFYHCFTVQILVFLRGERCDNRRNVAIEATIES
jgi:hypothetical protein